MATKPDESGEPKTECASCHEVVAALEITRVGGRDLCRNCASLWFSGDGEDDDE